MGGPVPVRNLGGGFVVVCLQSLPSAAGRSIVVTLPDEIDLANVSNVGDRLAAACRSGVTRVIADLTLTSFCDARGARMLAEAQCAATQSGTELRFVIASLWVQHILDVAGVADRLEIYPSLDQAIGLAARIA